MLEPLIAAIQQAVKPEPLENGYYWSKQVYLPPKETTPSPVCISTLQGVIDYVVADIDNLIDVCHIQVAGPETVFICSELEGRHKQRSTLLQADCSHVIGSKFKFSQWHDLESFVISLQSQFAQTDERDQILSVVGSIIDEDIRETNDDGITQNVTTRSGIARKADTAIPNPVLLRPYRSFPEIEQPESPFVLRLRKNNGVQVALFESGGGSWRLSAIQSIADHLKGKLPDSITILA